METPTPIAPASASPATNLSAAPVVLRALSPEKRAALLQQLVFPFGNAKPDTAVHIVAIAAGMQRVHQALTASLAPDGRVAQLMASAILQEIPQMGELAALQAAQSVVINRRDDALSTAAAFAPNGALMQEAVAMAEAARQGKLAPNPAASAAAGTQINRVPPRASAGGIVSFADLPAYVEIAAGDALPEGKHSELAQQMTLTYPGFKENGALITLAKGDGLHVVHRALAKAFAPGGAVAREIAGTIRQHMPEVPQKIAEQAADGYCLKRAHAASVVEVAYALDKPLVQDAMLGFKQHHAAAAPTQHAGQTAQGAPSSGKLQQITALGGLPASTVAKLLL